MLPLYDIESKLVYVWLRIASVCLIRHAMTRTDSRNMTCLNVTPGPSKHISDWMAAKIASKC